MDHFQYKDSSNTVKTSWPSNEQTKIVPNANNDDEQMRSIINQIAQAVSDSGFSPTHHKKIALRHRSEWPFLWDKIDALLDFHAKQGQINNEPWRKNR